MRSVPADDPAVVAEVRAAFEAYEAALVANDLEALDGWFLDSPRIVRVAFGEVQFGAGEVAAGRRAVPRQTAPRTIERLEIRAWREDTATVLAICRIDGTGALVHQSQTWIRADGAWRIVAAHVSLA